jgi:hypothetical protein
MKNLVAREARILAPALDWLALRNWANALVICLLPHPPNPSARKRHPPGPSAPLPARLRMQRLRLGRERARALNIKIISFCVSERFYWPALMLLLSPPPHAAALPPTPPTLILTLTLTLIPTPAPTPTSTRPNSGCWVWGASCADGPWFPWFSIYC